ncbi:hypothetical protein PR202_ga07108 [Eleusine coracana subsp. coracana]|uniref:Rx N-terminal domain-containing protein n=1 Tax=Eleusine coracana subsp. coracana TaxID=191504 RepID=A0AAV5BWT0_ELECO|nr:hypothetical protein PR202_ga07108 [Eleusine coracana subsp. coracana]
METVLGAANWLLSKVLNKLSDELIAGYMASRNLGLNYDKIQIELLCTQTLLHEAQQRGLTSNPGLRGLLEMLSKKAYEAEDALDELHYFMIRDKLDGTREATPELGHDLRSNALHRCHSVRHAVGTIFLSFFSRSRKQDDADITNYPRNNKRARFDTDGDDDIERLPFDRVTMSTKINPESDWISLLAPFRKGEAKGNMVLVTTRLPKIANMVKEATSDPITLEGLEPDELWKFFQCLEELNAFCVKKESVGFELAELGKLKKLRGRLIVHNLEKVRTKEEAEEAKLKNKCNLNELSLDFDRGQQPAIGHEHDVIDGLQPHPSLEVLRIFNHSGPTGPSWLTRDICVTTLECLYLSGVSWDILPPFGRLPLLKSLSLFEIGGLRQLRLDSGGLTDISFKHLEKIILCKIPDLVEWIGGDNFHLFSRLTHISCSDCPNLKMFPFSDYNGPSAEDAPHILLTDLQKLSSLKELVVSEGVFWEELGDGVVLLSVQSSPSKDCIQPRVPILQHAALKLHFPQSTPTLHKDNNSRAIGDGTECRGDRIIPPPRGSIAKQFVKPPPAHLYRPAAAEGCWDALLVELVWETFRTQKAKILSPLSSCLVLFFGVPHKGTGSTLARLTSSQYVQPSKAIPADPQFKQIVTSPYAHVLAAMLLLQK